MPEIERRFIRLPQVLEIIPISKSSWWMGVKNGKFPAPTKLGERTSAWLLGDIEKLVDKLAGKAPLDK